MREAVKGGRREADGAWPILETTWAYARHELLYLCWALMEAALIAPAALAVMPWARYWPSSAFTVWLLLVMLIPFNLSRLLTLAGVSLKRQRRVIGLALALTLLISLRTMLYETSSLFDLSWLVELVRHFSGGNPFWGRDLSLFFLIVVIWWRGISLTSRGVSVQEAGLRLRVGGLIMVPVIATLGLLPVSAPATPFVLLFFLTGLMAVALARAEEIALDRTNLSYPMQPRWVAAIFLTSLAIVLVAGLVGVALSGRGLPEIVRWLSPLWDALLFMGVVVVTTVAYFTLILLRPLQWLASLLFRLLGDVGIEAAPEPEELPGEFGNTNVDQLFQLLSDSNRELLLWINRLAIVFIVAGALLLLYLALSRYFRQREMALASQESGAAAAPERGAKAGLGERLLQRLGLWRRWRTVATLRRLYRQMCEAAAARGFPRPPSQTPYEYLETLKEVWPEGRQETRLITDAYVRVRYGELPESEEELDALRQAWQRLERMPEPE